jgi:hypothetical protein
VGLEPSQSLLGLFTDLRRRRECRRRFRFLGVTVAQRVSGYTRIADDVYQTPAWPVAALLQCVPITTTWDPGAGPGALVSALIALGVEAVGTTKDFFSTEPPRGIDTITCNPPYGRGGTLAVRFIVRALQLASIQRVYMLLPIDFDSAISRQPLFRCCPTFAGKIVLLGRIRWIPNSDGSPSTNHCWLIWNRAHTGAPTLHYVTKQEVEDRYDA